jgi:hypothetical protein
MSSKGKNILLWIVAIIITVGLVIYQRSTGPTYPVRGSIEIDGGNIDFKLIRTFGGEEDALVEIEIANKGVTGVITQKRYKSFDKWVDSQMIRKKDMLIGVIPNQPAAGKVEYKITLNHNGEIYELTKIPVIIRFKGAVPRPVLIPHIFFMFMSLLFALRVGLEVFFRRQDTAYYTGIVIITLLLGGLILGPIVQKYAFDAYWTGWPFGNDLTDNKTLFVFIFWVIAWFVLRKKPENKLWPVLAVIAMLLVYAIPHSVLGSEIDHTKTIKNNTEIKSE